MLHLESFDSIKSKSYIEDMLLYFEDKGQIKNLDILSMDSATTFRVFFNVNEEIVGFAKLKLLDEIIERLNKRFKNVYFQTSWMWIDTVDKNHKYVRQSMYKELEENMIKQLSNLQEYTSPKYPGWSFYGPNKENIYFQYGRQYRDAHITHNIWHNFSYRYRLNNQDISSMFKEIITKLYGLDINKAHEEQSGRVL